jgi:hypothetical protein
VAPASLEASCPAFLRPLPALRAGCSPTYVPPMICLPTSGGNSARARLAVWVAFSIASCDLSAVSLLALMPK